MKNLHDLFSYDPVTGIFWDLQRNRRAGCSQSVGLGRYRIIRIKEERIKEHNLAFYLMLGDWPSKIVDHIDGDGCNNRWENLRSCGYAENNRNRALHKNSKTKICGVHIDSKSGKWRAEITKDKKRIRLGFFDNLFDAACARRSEELRLGFSKRHGRAKIK